ncbi:AAA family ATPase [Agrobacterium rosae]|uniref:Recombination protein F n=1 Tax=Agrobacterium rosae TaxID=1972867 RepID=A0A1R3U8D4_9HYPH|nr:ATP-binding protein [Agrobacterium rosae]SCX34549.1 recombination protein F [Agrobacterium rosae]
MVIDPNRPPRRQRNAPLYIDSFNVGAFRGLTEVRLENLSRINLLVGSNNAGKTSILEAIAVHFNAFEVVEWYNIARTREGRSVTPFADALSTLDSLRWMFPSDNALMWDDGNALAIHLESSRGDATDIVTATCKQTRGVLPYEMIRRAIGNNRAAPDGEPVEDVGLLIAVKATLAQGMLLPIEHAMDFQIWSQLGLRSEMNRPRGSVNLQFLAPYGHRSTPQNLRRLTESTHSGTRNDIDALLRDLDERLHGVEIITSEDGRTPKIAVRTKKGGLFPLAVLGDGVRRALSIALALQSAKDGILLIDEIEAALHVSALDRVYRWLSNAVETYNVQVFATTHSLEAIDAIIKAKSPAEHSDLSGYNIAPSEKENVKRYTGGMLHRLVHQRGLDIRS